MQRFHVRLRYQRGVLFMLLLCMLLGSLLGAFCFLLSEWTLSFEELRLPGSSPLHYAFLRILIFPALMCVSLLLQRPWLFPLLFFCRGFTIACSLCAWVSAGTTVLQAYIPCFILETLLSLPALLLLGAVWYEDARRGRIELFPALLLFPAAIGLLLEHLIVL